VPAPRTRAGRRDTIASLMHLETLTFRRFFGIVRFPNKHGAIVGVLFGFESEGRKVYSARVSGNPVLREGATVTVALAKANAWDEILGWLDHQDGHIHQGSADRDWHRVGGAIALTAVPMAFAGVAKSAAGRSVAICCVVIGLIVIGEMCRGLWLHSRSQRLLQAKRKEMQQEGQLDPPPRQGHVANSIPANERLMNLLLSAALLTYGWLALRINDVFVPGKRGRGLHFHDAAAKFMVLAMVCACVVMLSVVFDHYDRRDNERQYRRFANTFCLLGYGCVAIAVFLNIRS